MISRNAVLVFVVVVIAASGITAGGLSDGPIGLAASTSNYPPGAVIDIGSNRIPGGHFAHEQIGFSGKRSFDSDGSIVSYSWEFGDGHTGVGETTSHQYNFIGTFTITLTVTDDDGATDTASTTIEVINDPPKADFVFSPSNPTTADSIQFNGARTVDRNDFNPRIFHLRFDWSFGDGTTGHGLFPSHSYADNGTYTVTLSVDDDHGGTDTVSKTITVANVPPAPNFTHTPSNPTTADSIEFNASSTIDSDGNITGYHWTFDDGATANGEVVTHTYADNGTYNVTLTATDDDGATNSTTRKITILNVPPTANFSHSPIEPEAGETVTFDGTLSADSDGVVAAYHWDFGDGNTSTGPTPSHTYSNTGNYTVVLTVTDDDGATDMIQRNITVVAFSDPIVINNNEIGPPQDNDGDGVYEDVNGDGTLNGQDVSALAQIIQAYLNGEISLTQAQIDALDFDGDGELDQQDIAALSQQIGGGGGGGQGP